MDNRKSKTKQIMGITFCVNRSCAIKEHCGRHQMNNDESHFIMWCSYAYFEPESLNECKYFYTLDSEDENYNKLKNISC